MKTRLFTILLLIAAIALHIAALCGCAMTRSKTPEGGAFTSVSVLENAEEKTTTFDPATGYVTVTTTGQNQTEGAKIIAAGVVSLETVKSTADFMMKRLGKEQAIETATIEAGSQLDLAKEANRSAEVMATIPPVVE